MAAGRESLGGGGQRSRSLQRKSHSPRTGSVFPALIHDSRAGERGVLSMQKVTFATSGMIFAPQTDQALTPGLEGVGGRATLSRARDQCAAAFRSATIRELMRGRTSTRKGVLINEICKVKGAGRRNLCRVYSRTPGPSRVALVLSYVNSRVTRLIRE